jgi:hypothetical protein
MSFLNAHTELMTELANTMQIIGSEMQSQDLRAQGPTAGVIPAAADEVSLLTALQFATHAAMYQAAAAKGAAVHAMIVDALRTAAGSYAATESANAAILG